MMTYAATEDNDELREYIKANDAVSNYTENKLQAELEETRKNLQG